MVDAVANIPPTPSRAIICVWSANRWRALACAAMRFLPLAGLLLTSCSKSPQFSILSEPPAETREAMEVLPGSWQFHDGSPVLYDRVSGKGGPYHVYLQKTPLQIMSISYRVYVFDAKFGAVLFGEVTATQGEEPNKVVWANPPEIEFRVPSQGVHPRKIALVPMSLAHIQREDAKLTKIEEVVRAAARNPDSFDENGKIRPEVDAAIQKQIENIRSGAKAPDGKESSLVLPGPSK